jgi:hypothetical protein
VLKRIKYTLKFYRRPAALQLPRLFLIIKSSHQSVKESMSRLIEEFKKASRAVAPAMGFRTARSTAPAPRILLIASLEPGDVKSPSGLPAGVHAVLVRLAGGALTAKQAQQIAAALPDIPWGFNPGDDDEKKATTLIKAGADFMVFPAASRVSATPGDEKLGKILQVESSMDDGLLRAANDLPVDAVLVADTFEDGGALVWHQLMIYQHLANFISKPLIVPAPVSIAGAELKALWDAGVDGIIVETDAAGAEGLKALRQAIDNLPPRSARKRGRADAVLPRLAGEARTEPPEEDEEEDE